MATSSLDEGAVFPLSLKHLYLIKWKDAKGQEKRFKLIKKVMIKWRQLGVLLRLESGDLDNWWRQYQGNAEECWRKVMEYWLEGGSEEEDYPVTWEGLYALLKDGDLPEYAEQLKEAVDKAVLNPLRSPEGSITSASIANEASLNLLRSPKGSVASASVIGEAALSPLWSPENSTASASFTDQESPFNSAKLNSLSLAQSIEGSMAKEYWTACRKGTLSRVEELLESGSVNPNYSEISGGQSVLMCAAEYGHLNVAECLMKFEADINQQDKNGCTALIYAVRACHMEIVRCLLSHPEIDLNCADHGGNTPLSLVIEKNDVKMLEILLSVPNIVERVSVDTRDGALRVAVESDNVDAVKRLLKVFPDAIDVLQELEEMSEEMAKFLGLDLQKPPSTLAKFVGLFIRKNSKLIEAAKNNNSIKVEKLLQDGANPDTTEISIMQWTPLLWASHRGNTETVRVLLKHKANPTLAANNGYTALILASRRGNYEVVKLLVECEGAGVNTKNKTRGWTALMWASQTQDGVLGTETEKVTYDAMLRRRKAAEILLGAGADVNLAADNGWTPLMQASQDGEVELVKILCAQKDIKLNHKSKSSWSALTVACRKERSDIVRVLVEAGADVNLQKDGGLTALHIASYKQMVDSVDVLLGARTAGPQTVDIQDEWGMTPLMLAAKPIVSTSKVDEKRKIQKKLLRQLVIKHKAKVNIKAEKYAQWSALFFAIKNGDLDIVDLLIQNNADAHIEDKHGHTPMSFSKGLKEKQIYNHLEKKCEALREGQHDTTASLGDEATTSREAQDGKAFGLVDRTNYFGTEMHWKTTQLPKIISNV